MRPARVAAALLVLGCALLLFALADVQAAPGLEAPGLLEDRGPIRIDGDQDFDAARGVRGGTGTAEDPFRIANWRISEPRLHIRIANTTKHFVVRNNLLAGTCDPASEAAVQGCHIEAGIHLSNLSAATGSVVHNHIRGMDRSGISVEFAGQLEFVENLVEGGVTLPDAAGTNAGIVARFTDRLEVRGNHVLGAGPQNGSAVTAGIRIIASNGTVLVGNRVANATETGLNTVAVRRFVAEDNDLVGNRLGYAHQALDGRFAFNNVTDNQLYGILVARGNSWLDVHRNVLARNGGGVEVQEPANVTVHNNTFDQHRDFGLSIAGNAFADAGFNWWGAADGPAVANYTTGSGERVVFPSNATATQVIWEPWLRERPASGTVGAFASRETAARVAASPAGAGELVPVAVLEGPGQAFVLSETLFSAARSYDPEGGPLRFAWDFGDGGRASTMRASHAYNATGEYVVQLTVTDAQGIGATASLAVRVVREPLGVRLLVNATAHRGETLELVAEPLGQALGPITYRFALAGPGSFAGDPGAQANATARFDAPGEHIVGVEVLAGGERAVAFERVLVQNRPPTAHVAFTPAVGDTRTEFNFTGAGSTDPDGDALAYTWDLGGGRTASGADVTHRFPAEGTHVVVLTVSDGLASATDQVAVEVRAAPPAEEPERPAPLPAALAAAALALAAARARGRRR